MKQKRRIGSICYLFYSSLACMKNNLCTLIIKFWITQVNQNDKQKSHLFPLLCRKLDVGLFSVFTAATFLKLVMIVIQESVSMGTSTGDL